MDPAFSLLASLALALLFAISAYHKARDQSRFEAILADYRLLPPLLIVPATRTFTLVEIALTAALVLPATARAASLVAAGLLIAYSFAIGINLARGRREIDCGCGGDSGQPLGSGLLVRNAVLIVIATASSVPMPVGARVLSPFDGITIAFGLATLTLVWQAAGQLHSNPMPSSESERRILR
jgi:hypothetical protein